MAKSVYLAGPEVFLLNAREILDQKIALTREAGLIPISPGDLEYPRRKPGKSWAWRSAPSTSG